MLKQGIYYYLEAMDGKVRVSFLFLSILLIVSVIYSRFLLSVSMFGWVILAFYSFRKPLNLCDNKGLVLTIGLFVMVAFSGIYSENTNDWLHHVRIRLPFLALPMAMMMIPRPDRKIFYMIQYMIVATIFISTIPVLYPVITDFDTIYKGLAEGQPIATPVQHTKYSLMVAYAILAGGLLYLEDLPHGRMIKKWVMASIISYLFIFLHVLAVRSGLVVFYLSALSLSVYSTLRQRSFRTLIVALVLTITLPVIGFMTIPSLNKRIHYMIYDLNEFRKGDGDQYSDSDRINSLIIGWEIFTEHPFLGIGMGDLKKECNDKYMQHFGPDKYVLYPHNQYLFIMAGMGLVGLIMFLYFLWGPLCIAHNFRNPYLLTIVLVFSLGFLFDNALERSFSAGFYAFLVSLGLRVRLNKH